MGWSRIRRFVGAAVAAGLLATVLPTAVVLATTPTVTTLEISDLSPDRGDVVTYTVRVVPSPVTYGAVSFESSPDGVTWTEDQVVTYWNPDHELIWTTPIDGSVPLGERFVRARFHGVEDLDPSTSDPVAQTIGLRQTSITGLIVHSTTYAAMVPGSLSLEILCFVVGGGGTVVFEEQDGAAWDELGRHDVTYGGPNTSPGAWIEVPGFPLGEHTVRARLLASDYAAPSEQAITFTVTKASGTLTIYGPQTVQAHHAVQLDVGLALPSTGVTTTALVTLTDADTNNVLASGPAYATYLFDSLPLGVHHFAASFDGDGNFESATASLTVTVIADSVDTTSVGLSPTTFYPYKDGYRDTTSISGVRLETASVAISIYSPKGSVVRRATIGAGIGHYTFTWNGRTTSGATLAAGKYKVVQKFTDALGSTKSLTSYVTISAKRLYYHTVTLTKTAAQSTKRASSWIGWSFSLPSATAYKSLVLSIYGVTGVPPARFGAWNYAVCPYAATWSPSCVLHAGYLPYTTGWASRSLSVTNERYAHTVRAFAFANAYASVGKVSTIRLKVTYGVLK